MKSGTKHRVSFLRGPSWFSVSSVVKIFPAAGHGRTFRTDTKIPAQDFRGQRNDHWPALNRAHSRVRMRSAAWGTGPMVKYRVISLSEGNADVSAISARLAGTALG